MSLLHGEITVSDLTRQEVIRKRDRARYAALTPEAKKRKFDLSNQTTASIAARQRYSDRNRDKTRARNLARYHATPIEQRRAARKPLEERREYHRQWREKNREHVREMARKRAKKLRVKDPAKAKAQRDKWRQANPEKVLAATRKRCKRKWLTDINWKLKLTLRNQLNRALKHNRRTGGVITLLGCSVEDFKLYIESKFDVGMGWKNHGINGWHLDHIVPCALFDLTKEEHRKRCFHFSNYQPMWATANMSKGARLTKSHQFSML